MTKVKLIGGPKHGRIINLDENQYVFSLHHFKRGPIDVKSGAGQSVPTLVSNVTDYTLVYKNGSPLEIGGLRFMIKRGMNTENSKILRKYYEQQAGQKYSTELV